MKIIVSVAIAAVAGCGGAESARDAAIGDDAARDGAPNTTTALVATMMATRTLDRAFYGVNASDGTLHVEINLGGPTGCPEMTSPTPDYTLILGRVSTTAWTSPSSFLDYRGDMLGGPLGASATMVMLGNGVYSAGAHVSIDVDVVFGAGTVTGHLHAIHCSSLDG